MAALTQKNLSEPDYPVQPIPRVVVPRNGRFEVQENGVAIGDFPSERHANAFATVPDMVCALREQQHAIDMLGEQIDQMRGLFNEDEDATIEEAMQAGTEAAALGSTALTRVLA